MLTLFFARHLILWDRVTSRFPALENLPFFRALGLVGLAVVAATTVQLLLMTGAGLYFMISDSTPFTEVWTQRPIDYLTLFGLLLAATLSWCVVPRMLIRLSPVERPPTDREWKARGLRACDGDDPEGISSAHRDPGGPQALHTV